MKLERIKVVRVGKPSSDAQGKIATVVAAVSEHFNQTTAFIFLTLDACRSRERDHLAYQQRVCSAL
jgi:hypothetical protein